LHCQALTLVILDTWGDGHFVGLSGLQVLGADGQTLPLDASRVSADPPDLNVFPGHSGTRRHSQRGACWLGIPGWACVPLGLADEPQDGRQGQLLSASSDAGPLHVLAGDVRTADKLVDGTSNTMDDTHM
jgi:hypothetical protein